MKILVTTHFSGFNKFEQKVFETSLHDIEAFFCEKNDLEYPLVRDEFTVVNEHGVFINDRVECCESWVRIYDNAVVTADNPYKAITMTGEQCRERRKALGWSQDRLAKAAGVSTMTIVRLEKNHGHETRQVILKKIDAALRSNR